MPSLLWQRNDLPKHRYEPISGADRRELLPEAEDFERFEVLAPYSDRMEDENVLRTAAGRSVEQRLQDGVDAGALSTIHPTDLLAGLFRALMARHGVDRSTVDDVILDCVSQVGEQSGVPGRIAWLGAGPPETVPSTTVEHRCGSSQQAAHFAAHGIAAATTTSSSPSASSR